MVDGTLIPTMKYAHLTTGATTLRTTGGVLHSITVNTPAAGSITVADAVSGTTPAIAIITPTSTLGTGTYLFDVGFNTGLTVTLGATMDVTVAYF